MGQLPIDRVTPHVYPFSYTGLDYCGPFLVTIRRQREKRWVALFTCLTTRAVHLELSTDLSTDACLLCIRNFVNRRGTPKRIRSDNGTNFVGIEKELRGDTGFFDNDKIASEMSTIGVEWVYNCPASPHSGGCWERLVQSVKKVLQRVLKEVAPKPDTFYSVLVEAENIINSRPLTHLPISHQEEEPLTPNHFLLGRVNSTQTPQPFENKLLSLRKQWRVAQQLKNHFWSRWIAEYLPDLTRRTKWHKRTDPLKIGDLVIICDSSSPRSQWLRGRVVKVFPGKDGVVRSAEVKTATTNLRRPVSKLAVLDVSQSPNICEVSGAIHGGRDVEC